MLTLTSVHTAPVCPAGPGRVYLQDLDLDGGSAGGMKGWRLAIGNCLFELLLEKFLEWMILWKSKKNSHDPPGSNHKETQTSQVESVTQHQVLFMFVKPRIVQNLSPLHEHNSRSAMINISPWTKKQMNDKYSNKVQSLHVYDPSLKWPREPKHQGLEDRSLARGFWWNLH